MNKVLEFTNAVFLANVFAVMRLHLSKKKTRWYDAQLEVPSENDAFQIKDKAIFFFTFVLLKRKARVHVCRLLTNISENMDTTYIIPVCSNYTYINVTLYLVMFPPFCIKTLWKISTNIIIDCNQGLLVDMFYSFVVKRNEMFYFFLLYKHLFK